MWTTVLLAGVLSLLTKLAGFVVPQEWLDGPLVSRIMKYLPIALLAALVAVQTFGGSGGSVALDARAAGLAAAVVALCLRAPFPGGHHRGCSNRRNPAGVRDRLRDNDIRARPVGRYCARCSRGIVS